MTYTDGPGNTVSLLSERERGGGGGRTVSDSKAMDSLASIWLLGPGWGTLSIHGMSQYTDTLLVVNNSINAGGCAHVVTQSFTGV